MDPSEVSDQDAEALEEKQRRERQNQIDDIRWLMDQPRGRRLMWRLLSMTGMFRNAFSGNSDMTAFRCGEQNIGQQLMAEIHALTPELYHTMVKEAQQ